MGAAAAAPLADHHEGHHGEDIVRHLPKERLERSNPPPPPQYRPAPPVYKPAPKYAPAPKPYAPPPKYGKPQEKLPPQPYQFEYGVADQYSGTNFQAAETQDDQGTVLGKDGWLIMLQQKYPIVM